MRHVKQNKKMLITKKLLIILSIEELVGEINIVLI